MLRTSSQPPAAAIVLSEAESEKSMSASPVGVNSDLAGLGEHLPLSRPNCAPMQWLQSTAGIWALLGRAFVFGKDASRIQRQQLLKLSHNEDFAFGICFPIECHHASDYLEKYVCSK